MSDPAAPRDITESDPNGGGPDGLAGGMGVSSERTGKARGTPGEVSHGTEETRTAGTSTDSGPPDNLPS